jgi:hypothetical protein
MKNAKFIFKSQVNNVVHQLWKTDLFRKLHNEEGSVINLLVKELAKKSFTLFDYTDEVERTHMLLWFYHVGTREYENPYIHDLFYFHEFYHLVSFSQKKHTDFDEFKASMWDNELKASLMSEVFIYYFVPELRENTFKQRIWFDDLKEIFGYENITINEEIFNFEKLPKLLDRIKERRLMLRNDIETDLETEIDVKKYNTKDIWFEKWREDYIKAEEFRTTYENNVILNDLNAYFTLKESLASVTTNEIPFYNAAMK